MHCYLLFTPATCVHHRLWNYSGEQSFGCSRVSGSELVSCKHCENTSSTMNARAGFQKNTLLPILSIWFDERSQTSKAQSLNNPEKKCVLGTTAQFLFLHSMTLPACKKDSFFTVRSALNLSNHISLTSTLCIKYYHRSQKKELQCKATSAERVPAEDTRPFKIPLPKCPAE